MASGLYTTGILRLAASLEHARHLDKPDAVADVRAPLCGSKIVAEISIDDHGTLVALAFRANACALGQASAAVLAQRALGGDRHMIAAKRSALENILTADGANDPDWAELSEFAVARGYPARHGAILLPYDAIIAAYDKLN
jgi:NifU-like protein involved in Fe-S cluster formation